MLAVAWLLLCATASVQPAHAQSGEVCAVSLGTCGADPCPGGQYKKWLDCGTTQDRLSISCGSSTGCALKPVQGAAGKGVCVPTGYQAGALTAAFVKQFQTCWATPGVWDDQCQNAVQAYFVLTGCDRACLSEFLRGRNSLCGKSSSTECESTPTKACDNLQGGNDDHNVCSWNTKIETCRGSPCPGLFADWNYCVFNTGHSGTLDGQCPKACQKKNLGASANGTVPATVICVPTGAPKTPVTVDDLETYNTCSDTLEAARPASCESSMTKFEQATGCHPECKKDFTYFTDRTKTFCSGLPEEKCEFTVAPCQLESAPAPTNATGNSTPGTATTTTVTVSPGAPGEVTTVTVTDDGGSNLAPIIGGVVGGLLILLLLAIIALLLVRKKKNKRGNSSDLSKMASGKQPLVGEKEAVPFNGATPPHWQHAPPGPPGPWPAQGGAPQWGPMGAGGAYYNNAPHGAPGSQAALSMHSASGAAWPTASSIPGSSSGGMQRTVGSHAAAPAQRVKVTFMSGKDTFDVTTASSLGPMPRQDSLMSSLSGTSSPAQILDAQLDFIEQTQRGMLTRSIQLKGAQHRRLGGQGAVVFAHLAYKTETELAVKFFFDQAAFEKEAETAQIPEIRDAMPPVSKIEDSITERSTEGFPPPLNIAPLPPMIVTEKGESLDEFCNRQYPDPFTVVQFLIHVGKKLVNLHDNGWVHRDLKPANTIWLPSKNAWTLIDFGCASRAGEAAELSFSLWYAPPEIITAYKQGSHTLVADPSADVWALGVMTWELLTKTKFYGEAADMAAVVDTLTGKTALASERDLTPEVHRGLANQTFRTTVVAMLQRDPAQRPKMADLVHSWQSILMQQTTMPGQHAL